MFDIFGSLKDFIKIGAVCIDNSVFRLHYKFTFLVLIGFSILVTCRQFFGDPIDCIQNDDIPENVLETFCWIHATFTLPDAFGKKVGKEVPHPGIDTFTAGEKRVYHKYYQWVCFVLFLQALFFYAPHYLWKMWEGGRIESLVLELRSPIIKWSEKKENISLLVDYFKGNLNYHNTYVAYFYLCELMNLVNVIGQIYLIDVFLGGEFTKFGLQVIIFTEMEQEERVDPMVRVFPRITKCTFHRFGSSGDVQRHDAMCILPLNIINEKIYIFLWFWFMTLAVMSAFMLFYRTILILSPSSRYLVLRSRGRMAKKRDIHGFMSRAGLGDWFVLYLLSKNLDPLHFRDVVEELAVGLKTGEKLLTREDTREAVDDDTKLPEKCGISCDEYGSAKVPFSDM